ncbi:hypothetical protein D3C80_1453450 [compost metagenome]
MHIYIQIGNRINIKFITLCLAFLLLHFVIDIGQHFTQSQQSRGIFGNGFLIVIWISFLLRFWIHFTEILFVSKLTAIPFVIGKMKSFGIHFSTFGDRSILDKISLINRMCRIINTNRIFHTQFFQSFLMVFQFIRSVKITPGSIEFFCRFHFFKIMKQHVIFLLFFV